jgi:PIN domain nuclease of toxin-antitoxin system
VIAGVADTHAALWYVLAHPRLSHAARAFIDDAAANGNDVLLSSVSLAEIVYLIEKSRLPASAYDDLMAALRNPEYVLEEAPFDSHIVEAMRSVSRAEIPDMPDRIVAATALRFGVPVISRDGRIRSSTVRTIW